MSDNRIGISATNEAAAKWPSVDINGNSYERANGATAAISPTEFVVLPPGFVDTDGKLAALRAGQKAPAVVQPEAVEATQEEPPAEPTTRQKK